MLHLGMVSLISHTLADAKDHRNFKSGDSCYKPWEPNTFSQTLNPGPSKETVVLVQLCHEDAGQVQCLHLLQAPRLTPMKSDM